MLVAAKYAKHMQVQHAGLSVWIGHPQIKLFIIVLPLKSLSYVYPNYFQTNPNHVKLRILCNIPRHPYFGWFSPIKTHFFIYLPLWMGYGMTTQCVDVLGNGLGYVNVPLSQRQQSFLCCRAFGGLEPTQQRRVEMAVAWLSNVPILLPTLLSQPWINHHVYCFNHHVEWWHQRFLCLNRHSRWLNLVVLVKPG